MTKLAYGLLALVVTASCSRTTPAPVAPAAAPPPTVQPAPPPVAAAPVIHRLAAGSWPGSNTHRWGSRHYELRTSAGQLEVRIHDAISFQGVGMQPSDMPPTRHACTPWEPAPPSVALPTTPVMVEHIRAHYTQSQPASAGRDFSYSYGRSLEACG